MIHYITILLSVSFATLTPRTSGHATKGHEMSGGAYAFHTGLMPNIFEFLPLELLIHDLMLANATSSVPQFGAIRTMRQTLSFGRAALNIMSRVSSYCQAFDIDLSAKQPFCQLTKAILWKTYHLAIDETTSEKLRRMKHNPLTIQ